MQGVSRVDMSLDWINEYLFDKFSKINVELTKLRRNSIEENQIPLQLENLNNAYSQTHRKETAMLAQVAKSYLDRFGVYAKVYNPPPFRRIQGMGQVVNDSFNFGITFSFNRNFTIRFSWRIDKDGAILRFGHLKSFSVASKKITQDDYFWTNVFQETLKSNEKYLEKLLERGYRTEGLRSKKEVDLKSYINNLLNSELNKTEIVGFVSRIDKKQLIDSPQLLTNSIGEMVDDFSPIIYKMLKFHNNQDSDTPLNVWVNNIAETSEQNEVDNNLASSITVVEKEVFFTGIQLTPYLSDQDFRQDLLNIGEDVGSLARLVSMRDVDNMAVGLFGAWGSGKSFFMKQMQQQVEELSQRKDNQFHENVVQIEFNAWHYMDTNLYASLADHIFKSVHQSYSDDNESEEKLFESLPVFHKLNQALKELEQKKQEQELKLKTKFEESAWGRLVDSPQLFIEEIEKIDPQIRLKDQVQKVIELREDGRQWSSDFKENLLKARLIYRFIPKGAWLTILILCLLFPIIYMTSPLWESIVTNAWHQTVLWFSPIAATITVLINFWNNKHVRVLRNSWGYVFDSLAAQAREREELQTEIEQIKEDQQRVVAELNEIKSGNIIKYYLEERLASEAYKKELGIIHVLRNDFEKLSQFMQTTQGKRNGIDRIVLYIDDLDRCTPQKVIEVLQAVHLMLSSNLFMVIVAVDIRWVTKCLKEEFNVSLENHENTHIATAFDYLEKIFQITFQIKPLTEEDGRTYLRELFGSDHHQSIKDEDVEAEETEDEEYETYEFDDDIIHSDPSDQETGKALDDYNRLHLSEEEIIKASAYAVLIGSSPRTMKRFVNIYRLMRSRYFNDFSQDATLFMLSLTLGYPQLSRELVYSIKQSTEQASLAEILSKLDGALEGISHVVSFVEERGLGRLPVSTMLTSAVRVSRYTFYLNEINS